MNKSKKIICLIISVILCLVCSSFLGCGQKVDSADFYNFNTEIHIEVYNARLTDELKQDISSLLSGLENEFSVNKSQSVIEVFNSQQVGQSQTLTNRQLEIFSTALDCFSFSNGKFNPAVYPLSRLWQFTPTFPVDNFSPPSQEQIDELLTNGSVDFLNGVTLNGNTITKQNANTKLDFGGIVKGYAVDKIAEMLVNNGIEEGYVNAGGSSMRILSCESLEITHPRPRMAGDTIIRINPPIKNLSVSTSGDYQKNHKDYKYSHIIDTSNGYPLATGIQSATILCPNGTFADAMSTALCLCEYDNSNELTDLMDKILVKYPSSQIYVVYQKENQTHIITNMKEDVDFTLLDNSCQVKSYNT